MLSDMSLVGTVRMPGGTPESAVRRAAGAAVKGEGKKDPPGGQSPSVAKDMASGWACPAQIGDRETVRLAERNKSNDLFRE
jgi:hypothetical protein